MKTQSAIIKAVMLSRANANGDYPIAIRVNYKGRVMKSLPIALPKNKWNEEKGVVVKTYPNAAMMNKIINDEIQKVRGRELEYQAKGEVYSAKDLIEIKIENETKERVSTSIKDIMDSLIEERGLSRNNQNRYITGYKALKLYFNSEDPDIRLITSDSMQGLALCDLAELKVDQFTLKSGTRTEKRMEPIPVTRNGQTATAYLPVENEVQFQYYEVRDVQRLKTREKVPLVIELTYTTSSLLHYYMATAKDRGGYLFPIYNEDMTEEQRFKHYKMVQTIIGKKLKELAKAVNKYAKDSNVENWVDIPSTFNFYSARHTFASVMATNGVSNATIAQMMGRTVAGIDNYVHSITSIDQLLKAKSNV